jgi:hypothetical protein
MPVVRATTLAVPLHIPDLHLRIKTGGKKKVSRVGEKLDGLYTLGVARVLVNAALRDEALTVSSMCQTTNKQQEEIYKVRVKGWG